MPQTGDILLIRYKLDPLGWLVQWFIKGRWNHSALVINNDYIFDCTSDGNRIKSIKKYKKKFLYEIKLIRFITLLPQEKVKLYEEMLKLVSYKKSGDTLFLIALIQVALNKKPFTNTCSGTVSYLFKKLGIKLSNKPYYLISPEDLNNIKTSKDVSNEL
jgi:hypothetical protein